jgi:hypothetical protein
MYRNYLFNLSKINWETTEECNHHNLNKKINELKIITIEIGQLIVEILFIAASTS